MKGMTKEKERRSFGVEMADLRVDLGVRPDQWAEEYVSITTDWEGR
jgi:hypothetical protein